MSGSMAEVEKILERPYARSVAPQGDGTYYAFIPEFPGCVAQGNTAGEALELLEGAARRWLAALLRQGKHAPPATLENEYSGRVLLRLRKDLHRQAALHAQQNGVSLNQFIATSVSASVGAYDLLGRVAKRNGKT